jgi:hypothetical protein
MTHSHQYHQQQGYANETNKNYCYPDEQRKTAATGGDSSSSSSLQISGNENIPTDYQYSQYQQRRLIQAALDDALETYEDSDPNNNEDPFFDWNTVRDLLQKLSTITTARPLGQKQNFCRESFEHDTYGRTLLLKLLERDVPLVCLREALQIFPTAIDGSPVAFFTACHASTPEIAGYMMQHIVTINNGKKECPYPWIFSPYISFDGAQSIVRAFPEGVWHKSSSACSSFLSSNNEDHSPLTYILFSQRMMERREFDQLLWQKIKLILVVASAAGDSERTSGNSVFPIHTILEQLMARPGKIRREVDFKISS